MINPPLRRLHNAHRRRLLLPHGPFQPHRHAAVAGDGELAAQHVVHERLDHVHVLADGVALGRRLVQPGVRLDSAARGDRRREMARRDLAVGVDGAADEEGRGAVTVSGEARDDGGLSVDGGVNLL